MTCVCVFVLMFALETLKIQSSQTRRTSTPPFLTLDSLKNCTRTFDPDIHRGIVKISSSVSFPLFCYIVNPPGSASSWGFPSHSARDCSSFLCRRTTSAPQLRPTCWSNECLKNKKTSKTRLEFSILITGGCICCGGTLEAVHLPRLQRLEWRY